MNVVGIRSRLNRASKKISPPPVTRESIEADLKAHGLDVEASWRFICAERPGPAQIHQLALQGKLIAAIDRYKGMTGSYFEKAQ